MTNPPPQSPTDPETYTSRSNTPPSACPTRPVLYQTTATPTTSPPQPNSIPNPFTTTAPRSPSPTTTPPLPPQDTALPTPSPTTTSASTPAHTPPSPHPITPLRFHYPAENIPLPPPCPNIHQCTLTATQQLQTTHKSTHVIRTADSQTKNNENTSIQAPSLMKRHDNKPLVLPQHIILPLSELLNVVNKYLVSCSCSKDSPLELQYKNTLGAASHLELTCKKCLVSYQSLVRQRRRIKKEWQIQITICPTNENIWKIYDQKHDGKPNRLIN